MDVLTTLDAPRSYSPAFDLPTAKRHEIDFDTEKSAFLPGIASTMRFVDHGVGGRADCMKILARPVPKPRAGEVLLEVAYAGVNRADVLQRSGQYFPPAGAPPHLGLEASGRIAAIGEGVKHWQVGDEVCALVPGGAYSEYCITPAAHCLPIPRSLSLLEAAALPETCFTVWTNLFERGALRAGETLLVHGGASSLGLTAIQLAKAFGVRVLATVGSLEKAQACLALGADRAIQYRQEDFVAAVKQETEGRGVDMVLDMVGGRYVERNLRALAVDGRLVQIAFLEGSLVCVDLMDLMLKRIRFSGSTLRARSSEDKASIAMALREKVWPLLEAGHVRPVIHQVFPLAEVRHAHDLLESREHIGKILLKVSKD